MKRIFAFLRRNRRRLLPTIRFAVIVFALGVLLFAPCLAMGADPVAAAKARASLALAAECDGDPVAAAKDRATLALATRAGSPCHGLCRDDYDDAIQDCKRTGKPMLLFVGGCDGVAKELPADWICVRQSEYQTPDVADPKSARILVLLRGDGSLQTPDRDRVYVRWSIPKATGASAIKSTVAHLIAPPSPVIAQPAIPPSPPSPAPAAWIVTAPPRPVVVASAPTVVCRT
jgi:hypothetical protein